MRYGLCINSSALAEGYEAGYDFAELRVDELQPLESDAEFASIRATLLASPLPVQVCNCFVPGTLKVVGPEVDHAAVRTHMEVVLRRASEVGIAVIVYGSGGARRSPDGFPLHIAQQQFSDSTRLAADIAARYNIIIAIEPLSAGECNIVNTVEEGAHIVKAIGHPHLRLLADIFHMARQGEPYSNLVQSLPYLAHIHTDSVSLPGLHGGASFDEPAFYAPLIHGSYPGRLSLEDHSDYLWNAQNTLPRVELFCKQLEVMKSLWAGAQ